MLDVIYNLFRGIVLKEVVVLFFSIFCVMFFRIGLVLFINIIKVLRLFMVGEIFLIV